MKYLDMFKISLAMACFLFLIAFFIGFPFWLLYTSITFLLSSFAFLFCQGIYKEGFQYAIFLGIMAIVTYFVSSPPTWMILIGVGALSAILQFIEFTFKKKKIFE